MNMCYEDVEQQVTELTTEQKLQRLLQHQINKQGTLDLLNEKQSSHCQCPHCHSDKVKKHGLIASRQRFYCNACSRTFMSTINTPLFRLKKIEKCQKFLGCMLDSLTVRKALASSPEQLTRGARI